MEPNEDPDGAKRQISKIVKKVKAYFVKGTVFRQIRAFATGKGLDDDKKRKIALVRRQEVNATSCGGMDLTFFLSAV